MDLNSRYFKIDADEERITLRFDAPGSLTLTSKSRAKELCHQVKARFRRWKPLNKSENGATVMIVFCRSNLDQVKKALLDVEYFLDQFSTARLTPRMVEEALGITSLERTRWTKDGRCLDQVPVRSGRDVSYFNSTSIPLARFPFSWKIPQS